MIAKYEGVMLPRNVSYWFQSSAPENLVLLRVGNSLENKQVEIIPIPGKFFTA